MMKQNTYHNTCTCKASSQSKYLDEPLSLVQDETKFHTECICKISHLNEFFHGTSGDDVYETFFALSDLKGNSPVSPLSCLVKCSCHLNDFPQ